MKIIAKTETGFILEASEYEAGRLIGYYSASDCRSKLAIGAEIKVNEMYEQLYKIRHMKGNVKEIERHANELLECIRTKMPVIEPVIAAIEAASPKDK